MADTLREVAQEAVARVEGAPPPSRITDHGTQVAGVLKAEADKDVFTTLQIAAGEQVSPAILRANLDISIGILEASGNIDRTKPGYQERFDRAEAAISRAEKYFSDQMSFEKFIKTNEGVAVLKSTGSFLMTHPALSEYFALVPPADRATAAKALAEKYLQDPYAREKVRQALLESAINKGEVPDEYSEIARKKDALTAKVSALEAKVKKLEGDPSVPVIGEIESLKARRKEFDRYVDPTAARLVRGKEFDAIQKKKAAIATLDSEINTLNYTLESLETDRLLLDAELRDARSRTPKTARTESAILAAISKKKKDIKNAQADKSAKEVEKIAMQAEIDAITADQLKIDEDIKQKIEELRQVKDSLATTKNERDEQILKLKKLEAGKARTEELAVSELENIFKKGIEQELMERLDRAKEAADKAMEESAERAKDVDEKQYLELRAKRHKTADGKINADTINEDFTEMKKDSTEYHIVLNTANPNEVNITEMPAGGWGGTPPPGNEIYYLTGPEIAIIKMMNKTKEFGGKFILGKLKDPEWMKTESQAFATQVLREKMYASRGWFARWRTGVNVKKLTSSEITKIKNSTWGMNILEQALEQNKAHIEQLDAAMKSGALQGEVLRGPGTWREKIGRMNNKQLALLILALTTGGALLGPLALPAATGAGTFVGGLSLAQAGGALADATAGGVAARRSRS